MNLEKAEWITVVDPGYGLSLTEIGLDGYSPSEVSLVFETIDRDQPDFICEWGTNVGQSARMFYEVSRGLGVNCPIHSIEISDDVVGGRGKFVEGLPVTLHLGLGLETCLSLYNQSGAKRPLVFLDDNHVYQSVLDQLVVLNREMPEATLLLHDVFTDYGDDGVVLGEPGQAVRDWNNRDLYEIVGTQPMLRMTPK